ncbi:pyridoxamine 5-phosphate oxidase [Mixta theicola]|uniref:Pyridoxamine 5-phosphate oxidase n=1 Tax=Mixta theicola TaxID=1458355 RepID=A0A2K1Q6I7_9GAMM|nr:pyridoxamine 5'-phosphate oxidase family protein [Mixta theicola]PNS10645.1 pyridoxamine 5-phosphate oxidase [Mixta theicola]GLR10972.1 hypothetical protein GCM10007905_36920 [Mixta theicola]
MESESEVYTRPEPIVELPEAVFSRLRGDIKPQAVNEAVRLSTVDADGWPHAAQLSLGEVFAVDRQTLRVALWPHSHTTENLRRDGRLSVAMAYDRGIIEMRGRAIQIAENETDLNLAVFEIDIGNIQLHRSDYADVATGVTFKLHEPEKVEARWQHQRHALSSL